MKKYEKVLAATGGNEILAVIENLPVSANGFFLSEEQLAGIEAALGASEAAQAELSTAQASLATITESLETSNGQLATVQARIIELEAMSGTPSSTSNAADEFEDDKNKVDHMAFDFQQDILNRINA